MMHHFRNAWIFLCIFLVPVCAWAQQSGQEYFEQGNQLYNQKKFDQAIASYGRAIQAQPISLPKAYLNCARAYSMKKDYASSSQYYHFYEIVAENTENDKKFKAEYRAIAKKAKNLTYIRDNAQTMVLGQLQSMISRQGVFWTPQGNGAVAFYDVLIRSGFAEPDLYDIQKKIVKGLMEEIRAEVTPPSGQPLPNLDRSGWEYIRNKIARARQFRDAPADESFLTAVESLATAWEAYYRGDFETAQTAFEASCRANPKLPAAYWGRVMLAFQRENNDGILDMIDEAQAVYQSAHIEQTERYFALLRAQVYTHHGDIQKSLEWLDTMHKAL